MPDNFPIQQLAGLFYKKYKDCFTKLTFVTPLYLPNEPNDYLMYFPSKGVAIKGPLFHNIRLFHFYSKYLVSKCKFTAKSLYRIVS